MEERRGALHGAAAKPEALYGAELAAMEREGGSPWCCIWAAVEEPRGSPWCCTTRSWGVIDEAEHAALEEAGELTLSSSQGTRG